jgi:N-acetylmuramic acid 6-phosphate etherase
MKDRSKLTTEQSNLRSMNLDTHSTLKVVDIINSEDALIAVAVRKERRRIAAAVELIADAFRTGGRLFYVGAGTSGRLGVLDASECPPTYGVPRTLVQGIIAGGKRALVRSIEGAEDSPEDGARELMKRKVTNRDVVVGIAASGITPFVHGAMAKARQVGAGTVFVTCAPQSKKLISADIIINPVVGPEVITGSTRMKAGTATKLVLNTLTTAAMVKTGKVHGNLMVDLRATNAKLRDRSERIVMQLTGLGRPAARRLLGKAAGRVKAGVVMHHQKMTLAEAAELLRRKNGSLRKALRQVKHG